MEGQFVPDDLPRDHVFAAPLVITKLSATSLDDPADTVEFKATLKDAEGKRCPEVAVYAEITGPERTGEGMAHTDLLGVVKFRMHGPPGEYRCRITNVAGNALDLDADASTLEATFTR